MLSQPPRETISRTTLIYKPAPFLLVISFHDPTNGRCLFRGSNSRPVRELHQMGSLRNTWRLIRHKSQPLPRCQPTKTSEMTQPGGLTAPAGLTFGVRSTVSGAALPPMVLPRVPVTSVGSGYKTPGTPLHCCCIQGESQLKFQAHNIITNLLYQNINKFYNFFTTLNFLTTQLRLPIPHLSTSLVRFQNT